jgi:hypothetical protein
VAAPEPEAAGAAGALDDEGGVGVADAEVAEAALGLGAGEQLRGASDDAGADLAGEQRDAEVGRGRGGVGVGGGVGGGVGVGVEVEAVSEAVSEAASEAVSESPQATVRAAANRMALTNRAGSRTTRSGMTG